ncbi:MAG: hypothetical protein E7342_02205 [Clostridiales bacterium]|nr:hypothetical protein [Clostridiales bacterium]
MDVIKELKIFYKRFKGEKGIIGYSTKKRPLYYFSIGGGEKKIIATYSIHAREYITTYLAMETIKYLSDKKLDGKIYFIPCVNPDGVKICIKGKPLYKANYRKVDLNVNFDADFGKGKSNLFYENDENYVGKHPFSEKETKALRDFTKLIRPNLTLSYHSKGEEIYYSFKQKGERLKKDFALAKEIALLTGYEIKETPFSSGGYKDWCIDKLSIPAFTIEVGNDNLTHPIKKESLPDIFNKNKEVLTRLLEKL